VGDRYNAGSKDVEKCISYLLDVPNATLSYENDGWVLRRGFITFYADNFWELSNRVDEHQKEYGSG
jgi:hypothetical protein